jgi:hypothetical protein
MYHGKPYDASDVSNIEEVCFNAITEEWEDCAILNKDGTISLEITYLLKWLKFCATSGDVRNALTWKSIRVNGEVIVDPKTLITLSSKRVLVEMWKKKAKRVFI